MTAPILIGLSAVVAALHGGELRALTVRPSGRLDPGPASALGLPSGSFDPLGHRTFELALRAFVTEQTGFELGYVEQLYTFGDKGRDAPLPDLGGGDTPPGARVVSVGYLALAPPVAAEDGAWLPWTRFFPWEDWRQGRPGIIDEVIAPGLSAWSRDDPARLARALALFALGGAPWNEERVLERYELLYEAGLAAEAERDRGRTAGRPTGQETGQEAGQEAGRACGPAVPGPPGPGAGLGQPMVSDHRRILATGLGRLRGKLKYRPIVFELTPEQFTLFDLQQAVEAISGVRLHKQNFRRMVERTGLVAGTGRYRAETGGRPAELFVYRRERAGSPTAIGFSLPGLKDSP